MKKIVHLREWKETAKEKESLNHYLQVLNFNQLITESKELLSELKKNPDNEKHTLKATLLLKEIKDRLNHSSPRMSESLQELSSKISPML